ncbi:hypothetical protein KFE96_07920 [Kordiimonas sp. SCSIO 12603]|uniref:hypothetical protein n=1 Tax=Kordiimonas sp. SCSIO 12603 TaxID=2829596 RepID=UPI002104748D|nr:hypothetical protein [Kordiimonas sp. SCSIO 12603]UTW60228.1 hypothetical protein KFE96_07920 [Kordiimonas sp. SCSIO 12603]
MNEIDLQKIEFAVRSNQSIDAFEMLFQTEIDRPETVTYDEVKALYHQTINLIAEIEEIGNHIHNVHYTKKGEVYTFDFDVLYSTVNWLSPNFKSNVVKSRDTFWTSLAFELFYESSFLLPGTAVELINFLKFNSGKTHRILETSIGNSFVDDFLMNLSPSGVSGTDFYSAVESLRTIDLTLNTLFIIENVLKSHTAHSYVKKRYNLDYEIDVYQDTFDFLSRRRNKTKQVNTTIDATNYAILTQLNKDHGKTGDNFHTIISNTKAMQKIPAHLSTLENQTIMMREDENGVASPRQASIYKLLIDVFPNKSEAETITREWVHQIRKFRDKLVYTLEHTNQGEHIKTDQLVNIDGITSLIWSFEGIQQKINESRKSSNKRIMLFKREFNSQQISEFTQQILDYFDRNIRNTEIFKRVFKNVESIKELDSNQPEIKTYTDDVLEEFGLKSGFYTKVDDVNFNFCYDHKHLRFWSTLNSVNKTIFIERVCELTKNLAQILLREKDLIANDYGVEMISHFTKGQWVVLHQNEIHELQSSAIEPISLKQLPKRFSFQLNNAQIIRYECPLYAIATDGTKLTFRCLPKFSEIILTAANSIISDQTPILSSTLIKFKFDELALS